ncbi:MAG: hypothetical protein KME22_09365 [Hassallia sp. WJT32-NPBG1]|nr:hypothetical protein [Hassallia sp. WJT32-NPBG1]
MKKTPASTMQTILRPLCQCVSPTFVNKLDFVRKSVIHAALHFWATLCKRFSVEQQELSVGYRFTISSRSVKPYHPRIMQLLLPPPTGFDHTCHRLILLAEIGKTWQRYNQASTKGTSR